MHFLRALLVGLTLLCAGMARPAHAAESYDNCTGFIGSLPAYISQQGVWCLDKDLSTPITTGNAITIGANNVTIDCNGFKLGGLAAGPTSQTWGITATEKLNSTVRNCNVRGFHVGLFLWGGGGHVVEDNRFDQNLHMAIGVRYGDTTTNVVRRNFVYDTGGSAYSTAGIWAYGDIVDNTVVGMFATAAGTDAKAISADGPGTQVRGNQVRELAAPSGLAVGIEVLATRIAVVDNRLGVEPARVGYGVRAYSTSDTFCAGNTVSGFSVALSNCRSSGGNDWW